MTTRWTMTIDCTDPALLARFWCTALGYEVSGPPKGCPNPSGSNASAPSAER